VGNAAIWYYPVAGKGLERIDLGEPLSDWQPEFVDDSTRFRGRGGHIAGVTFGGWERVVATLEQFSDRDLYGKLVALDRHLRAGGLCGIAHDSAKAWAGFSPGPLLRGDDEVYTGGDAFYAASLATDAALAAGDEVVLVSAPPECSIDVVEVESVSADGSRIVLTRGVLTDFTVGPILVRQHEFLPLGGLPADFRGRILTGDRNRLFTLELPLDSATERLVAHGMNLGAVFDQSSAGAPGKTDPWTPSRPRGGGASGTPKGGSGLFGLTPGRRGAS
jgi:hypothetical protein